MMNKGLERGMKIKVPVALMKRVEAIAVSMNLTPGDVVGIAIRRLLAAKDPLETATQIAKGETGSSVKTKVSN
jgi:hypothetical protein